MSRRSKKERALTGRSAVTNASFVAAAEVVGKLSTLVWTVVAAQQLGQFGFGAFNLALSVGLLLAAVGEWGFDSVLVRRGSRDTPRLSQYYTEVVTWQVGLGAPMLIIGAVVFALTTVDEEAAVAFALVMLAVLFDMVSDSARAAASTLHRQGITSAALIAQRVITAAVAIPAVITWGSVLALSGAFLLSSLLGVVLHWLALRRLGIHFSVRLLTAAGMRESLLGTGWVGLSSLVQVLQYRAGFILLGFFIGEEAVGSFAAAYRLFDTVLFLSFALVAAVFPLMSLDRTKAGLRQLSEASVSVLMGFYLPFAVVCLMDAPRLVEAVFGSEYAADSAPPLQWFAIAPVLFAVSYVGGTALVAASSTKRLLISTVVATTVCLALNVLLIPHFGPVGAAIALTAGLAVDAVLTTVFLRRVLDRWPRYLRQAAQPAMCSVLVLATMWFMDEPFLVELSVSALVYVICWGSLLRWSRSSAARLVQGLPSGSAETVVTTVQHGQDTTGREASDYTVATLSQDALPAGDRESESH